MIARVNREWGVYVEDHFVGTVTAAAEADALCAALVTYDPPFWADVYVQRLEYARAAALRCREAIAFLAAQVTLCASSARKQAQTIKELNRRAEALDADAARYSAQLEGVTA